MFVVLVKHVLLVLQFPPVFRFDLAIFLVTQHGDCTQREENDRREKDDDENGVVWKIRVDGMLFEEVGRGVGGWCSYDADMGGTCGGSTRLIDRDTDLPHLCRCTGCLLRVNWNDHM